MRSDPGSAPGLLEAWVQAWDLDRTALRTQAGAWTYGELFALVRQATGWLWEQGVRPGHTVALAMPRGVDWLAVHLATLRIGAISLPLNERYTEREFAHPLADAPADIAILPDAIAARFAAIPAGSVRAAIAGAMAFDPPAPTTSAVCLLLYTSGTTGRPKGVPLRARHILGTVDALKQAWGWSCEDVLLHALPLYHVHGLIVGVYGALSVGATIELMPAFEASEVVARLRQGPATVFMGVPTFYARLVACAPVDLSRVRLMTSGSAGLPAKVHQAMRERFGVSVVERYGMTEVGIVVSNTRADPKAGAIGCPLPGVEITLRDEAGQSVPDGTVGELWVKGPAVFDGYHGLPDATAAAFASDGGFRTGDLGFWRDGVLVLSGRRSELILVGGLNVYPAEIEQALMSLPGVVEAAVAGIVHADLGEVPAAAVVGDVDPDQLVIALRAVLAPYKLPRHIERVEALPRNAMGKVMKASLFAGQSTMLPATMLPATMLPATMLPATMLPATMLPATMLPATVLPATMLPATVLPATPGHEEP